MPFALSDYEAQVREFLDDNSHRTIEDLTIYVVGGNGTRTVFNLSRGNVINDNTNFPVEADINQAGYSSSNIASVDFKNGALTFTTAPVISQIVPTSLMVRYWYQEFLDADLDKFVNYGLQKIGISRIQDSTNYQNVSEANFNVVCLFGASQGYLTLSSRYSKMVNTTAEGKSSGKDAIAKNYLALSKEMEDRAEKERLAAQGARQGRSTVAQSTKFRVIPPAARFGGGR